MSSRKGYSLAPTRRLVVSAGATLLGAACLNRPALIDDQRVAAIERRIGGRLGVFAIDTGTGRTISYRASERFSMCSTFKTLLAAAILRKVENGELKIDEQISYEKADILVNSPVTQAHLDPVTGRGALSIAQLVEAAITVSDNCGANLLLDRVPPAELTAFIRNMGDSVTRLDRREIELNYNEPGDPRDTTSPEAMARSIVRILTTGAAIGQSSRDTIVAHMVAAPPGLNRLRAGLPKAWRAGDKTGTGRNGAYNDVAIAFPAGRKPVVIACYVSESSAGEDQKAAAHAGVARLVTEALR